MSGFTPSEAAELEALCGRPMLVRTAPTWQPTAEHVPLLEKLDRELAREVAAKAQATGAALAKLTATRIAILALDAAVKRELTEAQALRLSPYWLALQAALDGKRPPRAVGPRLQVCPAGDEAVSGPQAQTILLAAPAVELLPAADDAGAASGSIRQAVLEIFAKAREPRPSSKPFAYWFTNMGDPCLRALVYDAHDSDDGKPQAQMVGPLKWKLSAACGNAVGDLIEGAAKGLGYETQRRHLFDTGAVRVSGHSDILRVGSVVIDIKLVGEKKWEKVLTRPDAGHVGQVNGYAIESDTPRWALLYVRGASIFAAGEEDIEFKIYDGAADIELARALCGVAEQVDAHRKLRTLPERVFGAKPTGWPCGWCRHLKRCAPSEEHE